MTKAYHLLFYNVYRFSKWNSDDGWSEWKALLVIEVATIALILNIVVWLAVLSKKDVMPSGDPKYWAIPLVTLISIFNYRVLMDNNNRQPFWDEFKDYPKQKSSMGSLFVFLFLLGIFGSLILGFYQMSLIDWNQYR